MSSRFSVNLRVFLATALCAVVLISCSSVNSKSENSIGKSRIAGKILPTKSSAKIYLEQGRAVDSSTTDPVDGYFSIADITPGTYRVKIMAPGYDTFSTLISIEPDFSYEFGNVLLIPKSDNYNDTIPSTYDHYPQDNAEVIYLPPDKYSQGSSRLFISVSFDRPMNRASVEQALSITPPVQGGYFVWFQNMKKFNYQDETSSYTWDGRGLYEIASANKTGLALDSVSIQPSTPSAQITSYSVAKSFTFYFPRSSCFTDTTYTIRISRTAVDTSGTPLDTALEFKFKTVQSAIVYEGIEMLPHDGDDWVPLINTGIQFTFPRRMSEQSVQANLKINLCPKPSFLWQDYNHVNVYVGGIYVPDTTYVITIDSSMQDIEGKAIDTTRVMRFRTAPINVVSTVPQRGAVGVTYSSTITITFDTYIDRTSIAPLVSLVSADGDTITGNVNYLFYTNYPYTDTTYYLNQIRFDPFSNLKRNTFFTFSLAAGAKDLNGYAMKTDYQFSFITMP
jgi:hypothetical protein